MFIFTIQHAVYEQPSAIQSSN